MIPPPFRYLRAASVDDALFLLAEHPGAAVLAGGQTLVNALKLDLVAPSALVDVHRLPELSGVTEDSGKIRIGAAVTYAELTEDPVVGLRVPSLAHVAAGLVDRQVRNRGTIGGNCCLNDPANNFPPLLAALGAEFEVRTAASAVERIPAEEFFLGSLLTRAQSPNLLLAAHVPITDEATCVAYRHQQVGADSWAIARAVVRADIDRSGSVATARVFLGAVPDAPLRLRGVEDALTGGTLDADTVAGALAAFDESGVDTVGDSHGSARYRLAMARVQLRRALEDLRTSAPAREKVA